MRLSTDFIRIDSTTYRVYVKDPNVQLEEGNAYLISPINDYVYPYRGTITDLSHAMLVGIYSVKDRRNYLVIWPKTDLDKRKYSKTRIFQLTPDTIFTKLADDDIIDAPAYVINDENLFLPEIYSTDDIALAGAKYCMREKKIDFNIYANKFPTQVMKNNMRRLLTNGGGTLKMDMAERWGAIVGVNVGIVFWDKDGEQYPIDKEPGDKRKLYLATNSDINLSEVELVRIEK